MFSVVQFTLFFFTLVVSVHSLATPRARMAHIHHAIAARSPEPVPVALKPWAAPRKRAGRRCGKPTSSSIAPEPTKAADSAPPVAAAEAAPSTTTAPAAAAPAPAVPAPAAPAPAAPAPAAPAPPQDPAPAPSGGDVNSGDITFYGTGLGACGITNNDNEFITAVSHEMFDTFPGAGANPNANPICNKKINISHNGKTVTVIVTDRCAACAMYDLDLSPAAFNVLDNPGVGRTKATWTWA